MVEDEDLVMGSALAMQRRNREHYTVEIRET